MTKAQSFDFGCNLSFVILIMLLCMMDAQFKALTAGASAPVTVQLDRKGPDWIVSMATYEGHLADARKHFNELCAGKTTNVVAESSATPTGSSAAKPPPAPPLLSLSFPKGTSLDEAHAVRDEIYHWPEVACPVSY